MKHLLWSLFLVPCMGCFSPFTDTKKTPTPQGLPERPATYRPRVTPESITVKNAHEKALELYEELDQEEMQLTPPRKGL